MPAMKIIFILLTLLISTLAFAQEVSSPTKNEPIPVLPPLPDYFKGKPHPLGVRPDCSETPISANQLEEIARIDSVRSINDFVAQLPKDSMQTFTLVRNSKSTQRCIDQGKVEDNWPRVLRTSADGRVTMTYTCNPESCAYNQVEIIYYDDAGRELKTMSLDLNKQREQRAEKNSATCLPCHAYGTTMPDGSQQIKHVWPEYSQWSGCRDKNTGKKRDTIDFYGSNDDLMSEKVFRYEERHSAEYNGCTKEDFKASHKEEIDAFDTFKKKHLGEGSNNTQCYSSLPWAKPTGEPKSEFDPVLYSQYPYRKERDYNPPFDNYYLRPNLKFTELYSRLNSKRIAGVIGRSPEFDKIKLFLALEAANCLTSEDESTIKKLLPKLKYSFEFPGMLGAPETGTPLLSAYATYIGMSPSQWTLEFRGKDSTYNAAIPRLPDSVKNARSGYDTYMPEVAEAEILSLVAKTNSNIKKASKDAFTRGVSEGFGPQWSCIDDLGGAVREGHMGPGRPLCKSIRKSLNKYLQTIEPYCEPQAVTPEVFVAHVENKLDAQQIKHGRDIVEKKCLSCHKRDDPTIPSRLAFFSPNKSSGPVTNSSNQNERLANMAKNYLAKGIMPANGDRLSEEDQAAVVNYIKSLK